MSWKCKTHLEWNDIQLVSFLFFSLSWYWCISSCGAAQWPPARGQWSLLGGSWLKCVKQIAGNDGQQICLYDQTTRLLLVGSEEWPLGTEQRGRLLWHGRRSPTFQTVRWLSSHQPTGFSHRNRKGSHVKKKPFQLQPIELQCRTHTYIHTSKNTHSHTDKYTWAWSESKGWFQRQPEAKSKAGHLAPTLQLSCIHVKAKHMTFWLTVVFINLVHKKRKSSMRHYIIGCGPHSRYKQLVM